MVEVLNIAPVIRDLKRDKVVSGEILEVIEPAQLEEPLTSSLITRYLVQGSNNLAWKVFGISLCLTMATLALLLGST